MHANIKQIELQIVTQMAYSIDFDASIVEYLRLRYHLNAQFSLFFCSYLSATFGCHFSQISDRVFPALKRHLDLPCVGSFYTQR